MNSSEESLRSVERLKSLSDADIAALTQKCQWRRFVAGQEIIGYHEQTTDVFFVVQGSARVTIYSVAGKEVTFRDLPAGQIFGELSAIDGESRSANVVAIDPCLIASMPAADYWQALRDYPDFAAANLKALSGLIRMLTDRIFEFSTLAVKNRIHAEILRLGRKNEGADNTAVISPLPTHEEIANRISTHREAVTRELNNMAHNNLIERSGTKLVVLDMKRLRSMVEEVQGE